MCKHVNLFAAAAMVVGSYAMIASAADPMDTAATPAAGGSPAAAQGGTNSPQDMNAGAMANNQNNMNSAEDADAPRASDDDVTQVHRQLARVTTDALSANPLSDLKQDVSSKDQDRLNAAVSSDDIKAVSDQIKQAWHDKYHDDLQAPSSNNAFARVDVYQGNLMNDQETMASLKLLPSQMSDRASDPAAMPGTQNGRSQFFPPASPRGAEPTGTMVPHTIASATGSNGGAPGAEAGDVNSAKMMQLDKNMASAVYPNSHMLPPVVVPLVNEGTADSKTWKIVLPERVDSQRLHDNLLRELTMVKDHEDRWSNDETRQFGMLSHHIALALEDQQSGGNMGDAAQNASMRIQNGADNSMNNANNTANGMQQGNTNMTGSGNSTGAGTSNMGSNVGGASSATGNVSDSSTAQNPHNTNAGNDRNPTR